MTLIIGVRCEDGVVVAADRRRLARYEKGPEATKVFRLTCGAVLAGAGDDAVLSEARIIIERKVEETTRQSSVVKLFDIVEITMSVVNELVGLYRDRVEEPFGFVLGGLEDINRGRAKLYTIFGAGLSDVPWVSLGMGGSYARPLVELLLAQGDLSTEEATKAIPFLFTLVSNVQTTVGGGVDVCRVIDHQGSGDVSHVDEVNLMRLRAAMLRAMDIEPK